MSVRLPSADDVIAALGLQRHPEGGHYRETFRDSAGAGRPASTAIYYLLKRGERSHWHRIDAAEVWHFYLGAPLRLLIAEPGQALRDLRLGTDVLAGEELQAVVPKGAWQAASSFGDYSLAGCTVAPGFEFAGFELAPAGFEPRST
jgi:predicted cupin superfamily sugar epimerase